MFEVACGRGLTVLEWIVTLLQPFKSLPLPTQFSRLSGLGVSVIYVDANLQFDLKRLTAILDLNLTKRSQRSQSSVSGGKSGKKRVSAEQYIKSCLERLHLLQPTDSDQLILALERVKDSFLISNSDVGVLILDSLNAFYWLERPVDDERNFKFYESPRHKKICGSLTELVDTFKINVFVSLANIFRTSAVTGRGVVENDAENGAEAAASKDDFWTNHEWRKLRTFKLKLSKRVVYQDKNDGGTSDDAVGKTSVAPTMESVDFRSMMQQRIGKIPNQLVSYTLFNCASKTVEKRGKCGECGKT